MEWWAIWPFFLVPNTLFFSLVASYHVLLHRFLANFVTLTNSTKVNEPKLSREDKKHPFQRRNLIFQAALFFFFVLTSWNDSSENGISNLKMAAYVRDLWNYYTCGGYYDFGRKCRAVTDEITFTTPICLNVKVERKGR